MINTRRCRYVVAEMDEFRFGRLDDCEQLLRDAGLGPPYEKIGPVGLTLTIEWEGDCIAHDKHERTSTV